ncbi:hypothetical protein VNO77_28306 [Canavalia gladiata]|uniref:Uncharacterized protein n=1 Tax=Canavalia gladiata TaxID=3824 RepID=A0AAN9Q755_CANGL
MWHLLEPCLVLLCVKLRIHQSIHHRNMAAWTVAARRAADMARLSTRRTPSLLHSRGLAGAADHHGPPKVNFWQDPLSPSKWKEEHFVIVSLTGWGILFYSGYKFFTGGKDKNEEKVGASNKA